MWGFVWLLPSGLTYSLALHQLNSRNCQTCHSHAQSLDFVLSQSGHYLHPCLHQSGHYLHPCLHYPLLPQGFKICQNPRLLLITPAHLWGTIDWWPTRTYKPKQLVYRVYMLSCSPTKPRGSELWLPDTPIPLANQGLLRPNDHFSAIPSIFKRGAAAAR